MDNHPFPGRFVGAGHAPPAAICGRSFTGKVPGRAYPAPTDSIVGSGLDRSADACGTINAAGGSRPSPTNLP